MKPLLTYYGGKQNLIKDILPLIPEHKQYVEPFFGGGAVFFAKPRSEHEVINDIDGRITNFYRVVKTKFDELKLMIEGTAYSEVEHKRAKTILKTGQGTDVERAWAIWVQINMSFAAKMFAGFAFGNSGIIIKSVLNKKLNFTKKYAERLNLVEIFQRDALELIKLKDTEDTFFYLDPPYPDTEQGHYEGYTIDDFVKLLEVLKGIKGKFLLSSFYCDELENYINIYKWNNKIIKKICSAKKTQNGRRDKIKMESLTWNYDLLQRKLFLA